MLVVCLSKKNKAQIQNSNLKPKSEENMNMMSFKVCINKACSECIEWVTHLSMNSECVCYVMLCMYVYVMYVYGCMYVYVWVGVCVCDGCVCMFWWWCKPRKIVLCFWDWVLKINLSVKYKDGLFWHVIFHRVINQ